ncbi:unnamed protein product [Phyllotreta striolata]|uniref:Uncharacterized protein n=1 Tax=Phyllotreta striolata TaxID=444603 RepID=A0A9N9XQS9_PHYSR|nr:unnamed protein product [Phyllotreta striolata]
MHFYLIGVFSILSAAAAEECNCWEPLEVKTDDEGKQQCTGYGWTQGDPGKYTKIDWSQSCNTGPLCRCEDRWEIQSEFCASFGDDGEMTNKWDCENKADWDKYKEMQEAQLAVIFSEEKSTSPAPDGEQHTSEAAGEATRAEEAGVEETAEPQVTQTPEIAPESSQTTVSTEEPTIETNTESQSTVEPVF